MPSVCGSELVLFTTIGFHVAPSESSISSLLTFKASSEVGFPVL